jgi:hypothetical protein
MIVNSLASSTRRNAGSEAVKVLKTHLPKVINELLCEPTVDDVRPHAAELARDRRRRLRRIPLYLLAKVSPQIR